MNQLIIRDVNSACEVLELALQEHWNEQEFNYEVVIGEVVEPIHIKVYGEKFEDSITGLFARGIWEFQQEIYRAVALTLYGVPSIKKLQKEELEQYNITFYISAGSTVADGVLKQFLDFLLEAVKPMSPRLRAVFLGGVIVTLAGTYAGMNLGGDYIQAQKDVQIHNSTQATTVEMETEHTKQMELLARATAQVPQLQKWEEAVSSGTKSLAKSLEDGDSMDYGEIHISKEQIKAIKQKSPRTSPEEETISDKFTLYGFREISGDQFQFDIRGASGEYTVMIDTDTFSKDEITYLSHIAADIGTIELTIKLITVRDKVKAAYIADFDKPSFPEVAAE